MSSGAHKILENLAEETKQKFLARESIMSYSGYLDKVRATPQELVRNSASYLKAVFDHFGSRTLAGGQTRWNLFDIGTERQVPIIGCEKVQNEIYNILAGFVRQGYANKLILLHGPNGSAKTSILESLAFAMQRYSELNVGAVYTFHWIFPKDKNANPSKGGAESGPIGFQRDQDSSFQELSYAFLDESRIASKIHSEFRENPLYLLPIEQRRKFLTEALVEQTGLSPEDIEIPQHILLGGLSKRNQLIFENLLTAYDGDLGKVLRHVQIERFFFSRQYRVGIASVEPQMSIDAGERQLTMDRNMANLPAVLHNVSLHETVGPLVEANRGILEFSDMLKRPLEAYKYLLSTVEKGTLNLASSTAYLDLVFFATTNEKHLDAFKTLPDFASFKSRFELITVPYLLRASEEKSIYSRDMKIISKAKPVSPHVIETLATWAVLTRLRQPDPEHYESKFRPLLSRLDPRLKLKLYEGESIWSEFSAQEATLLVEIRKKLLSEFEDLVVYEGRFGASPRELRAILYKAIENPLHSTLTPMAIFDELDKLVKDRSVYEFLQLEPRGRYHQPQEFIRIVRLDFVRKFENELNMAMTLVEDSQYELMLKRYIDHVVAQLKREKLYNKITGSYEVPNEKMMRDMEGVLNIQMAPERFREQVLGRIAAFRIDNPQAEIEVNTIFSEVLRKIQDHYHDQQQKAVDENIRVILSLDHDERKNYSAEQIALAESTLSQLEKRYGYVPEASRECLKFFMSFRNHERKYQLANPA